MTALKLSERSLGLLNTIVLARLLTPQDFGVVAMCMVVVAALELFTSFGFDVVLIQRQDANKEQYDTAFTLNAIFGLVIGGILIASGGLVAWFYSDPRLTPVMYVVGANFFIRSLENIAIVDFRKHFQFQREAALRLSVKLVGIAATIPAALILHSYWALVLGMTAMSIFNVVLSYAMRPYRPTLTLAATRSIMNFSGWLMFNNAVFFVRAQIHTIFIGRLLGPKALGTFNMAYEIAMMTSTELIAPINRAVYPGYAKLSSDKAAFRTTFLDVFSLIMLISLPAGFGTAAIADDLAPLLLGNAWLATIPLIKILAIFGVLNTLNSNMMFVIHAVGKPRLATRIAIWDAALIAPMLYFSITRYGTMGAALSMVASYALVSTPLWWRTIGRELELPMTALLSRVWRPLLAGTSMYLAVTLLQANALTDLWRPVAIAIAVLAGATVYAVVLGLLWWLSGLSRGGESIVVDFVRQRLERAQSRPG